MWLYIQVQRTRPIPSLTVPLPLTHWHSVHIQPFIRSLSGLDWTAAQWQRSAKMTQINMCWQKKNKTQAYFTENKGREAGTKQTKQEGGELGVGFFLFSVSLVTTSISR